MEHDSLLPGFITVDEAAVRSKYSAQYVRRLVRQGVLIGKRLGHSWFIQERSLDEYLKRAMKSQDARRGPKELR